MGVGPKLPEQGVEMKIVEFLKYHESAPSLAVCETSERPRGYKTFFMHNSVEYELLNAHKYKNIK